MATEVKWIPNEDPSNDNNMPLSKKYRDDMEYIEKLEQDPEFMKYYKENYNPDYTYQSNSKSHGTPSKQQGHKSQVNTNSFSLFNPFASLLPFNLLQYFQNRRTKITALCSAGATLYLSSLYLDYQVKKTGLCSMSSPLRTMYKPPPSYLRRLVQTNSITQSSVKEKFRDIENGKSANEMRYSICVGEGKELYLKLRQSFISNMKSMSMDQVHIDGDDDDDDDDCDEAVQQNVGKQSSSHLIIDSIYVSPDSPKNIILVCKSENNEKNNLTRALMKSKLAKYGQWISGGYRYRLIPLKILNQVVDEEEKQVSFSTL